MTSKQKHDLKILKQAARKNGCKVTLEVDNLERFNKVVYRCSIDWVTRAKHFLSSGEFFKPYLLVEFEYFGSYEIKYTIMTPEKGGLYLNAAKDYSLTLDRMIKICDELQNGKFSER